jgi:cytochrome c5
MKTFQLIKTSLLVAVFVFVAGAVMLSATISTSAPEAASVVLTQDEGAKKTEEKSEAKDAEKKEIKGSDKKGKYYFKKSCKECHGKDGDGGEVTPISKTIKQWERYFKKDKHGEKNLSKEFDAEQLIHIKTFLINHAADSDQPETCG